MQIGKNEMQCKKCGSERTRKNGVSKGYQRFMCNSCGKTFSGTPEKHSEKTKKMAVWMSLNGVGIRKTALLLGTNHVNIINWLKKAHEVIIKPLETANADYSEEVDIIELDEIYTYVQKNSNKHSFGLLTLGEKSVLLRLK